MVDGAAEHRPKRLLLIGMMGSGKTTVGHLAAQRLGWPHLDSDAEVEEATGHTVPEIFGPRASARSGLPNERRWCGRSRSSR